MIPGPGDVVGDRYELLRELGGGDLGRVFVARDRHLNREVALRLLPAGEPDALLEEARWMGDAHAHTPAAVAVLDVVPTPGGGGYIVSDLVAGTPLEEVARRRAPLAVPEAAGYAIELLDAVIILRRHVPGAERAVVGSAMVATDGRIRVTRFSRPGPEVTGPVDPAVVGTAQTLRDLLIGAPMPASLTATSEDALAGRIATPEELRGRLLEEVTQQRPTAVAPPPPPQPEHRSWWPWIIGAIVVVAIAVALGLIFALQGDDNADQAKVPDVVGATAADAVNTVRDAGFSPQTVGHPNNDVAKGIVISTSPAGGQEADTGSKVTISVSQGTGNVAVPTVVGLSQDDAVTALADAGLESRVVEQPSSAAPDTVIDQNPAAGLQVAAGSTVAIIVATPEPTTSTETVTTPPATTTVP